MTEVITYSYDFINELSKKYNNKITDLEQLKFFNLIRINNKFNPRFTKRFNYTNWKKSINKEDEEKKNENDILLEKIRALLNKLTSKRLETLQIKLVEYIGNNNELLIQTINYLFEMAILQRIYVTVYAKLCVFLNKKYGEKIIKESILNKCKELFITHYKIQDIDEKEDYDIFCQNMKHKLKFIGIFHLVGEFYNVNLIISNTIWNYIRLLFKNLDSSIDTNTREKYVECLKDLLNKVGDKFSKEHKTFYKDILCKVKEYSESKKFSFREKFMFMDILDLNKKKWKITNKTENTNK
tara:strand:- start:101 stop:991 length:891 start_codon:yes stop_codon:yes gene_type:complete